MFERYTEQSRHAIFFARYEASQSGAEYIEPEHLLLGLVRESALLKELLSIPAQIALRDEIQRTTGTNNVISTSVDMPLSLPSRRILAYACEEADRLSQSNVGPEHLVLGLLREADSLAANLLRREGITLDEFRMQLAGMPSTSQRLNNQSIIQALRDTFDPITRRLSHETEPATVFLLQ